MRGAVKADYDNGVYSIVLKGITEEKSVNVDNFVNKLVKVDAGGKITLQALSKQTKSPMAQLLVLSERAAT